MCVCVVSVPFSGVRAGGDDRDVLAEVSVFEVEFDVESLLRHEQAGVLRALVEFAARRVALRIVGLLKGRIRRALPAVAT